MSSRSTLVSPCNEEFDQNAHVDLQPADGDEVQDGAGVDHGEAERRGDSGDSEDQRGEVEAGEPMRCLPCPRSPTQVERLAHEITRRTGHGVKLVSAGTQYVRTPRR